MQINNWSSYWMDLRLLPNPIQKAKSSRDSCSLMAAVVWEHVERRHRHQEQPDCALKITQPNRLISEAYDLILSTTAYKELKFVFRRKVCVLPLKSRRNIPLIYYVYGHYIHTFSWVDTLYELSLSPSSWTSLLLLLKIFLLANSVSR